MYVVVAVLTFVVIIEALGLFALYQHFGQMYTSSRTGRAAQGPAVDLPLRSERLRAINGSTMSTGEGALALVFASTNCNLCKRLRDELVATGASELPRGMPVAIVCAGRAADVAEWARDLDLPVIADPGYRLSVRFGINITPFVVVTDARGVVMTKGVVNSADQLGSAAESVLAAQERATSDALRVVESTPSTRAQAELAHAAHGEEH